MSEDLVNIEVNGQPVKARKGAMLIEVTDEVGIMVPRFCYHSKLSVAANCRMCLVEVEKAPKPLPACATPVMDGMKVFTHSSKALAAQRDTMGFLLINHPLDCPICDQGGECELQDVAMGYGEGVSRYSEAKRVVKDKNIGPLISTDMTRCIHCTRCVRFGAEIAGIPELGTTGRGEYMEIGTYVEKALTSELSGNVIDLCPVGALNAKPSRMGARAWELVQYPLVAPHDSMGSNIYVHTLRGKVIRVVPRDNEAINETWISDRDRFSYQGLYSDDRLQHPMIKRDGQWESASWEAALKAVIEGLAQTAAADIGALVSPTATLEEMYLLQKWLRGIGVQNIDHRLRQLDFSDQDIAPLFPWLGQSVEDLEQRDAILLVGSNVRKEQPIAAHRIRKASLQGAAVAVVNPRDFEFAFDVNSQMIQAPHKMIDALAEITAAVLTLSNAEVPDHLAEFVSDVKPSESAQEIAKSLHSGQSATVLLGSLAINHPEFALLRILSYEISAAAGAVFGYLPESGNAAGAWLSGLIPHRLPSGQPNPDIGKNAGQMTDMPCNAYVLFGIEPEFDCENPSTANAAMESAKFVVALSPYASEQTKSYANVLLPIASYTETSGTFVNAEGRWQSFQGVTTPPGEVRPAWRVLRVLGNMSKLSGFDYMSSTDVRDELKQLFSTEQDFSNQINPGKVLSRPSAPSGLMRISAPPIYSVDGIVRRASALQQTMDAESAGGVYLSSGQAEQLSLEDADEVLVRQDGLSVRMPTVIDDTVPDGCAWIPSATEAAAALGSSSGVISLEKV